MIFSLRLTTVLLIKPQKTVKLMDVTLDQHLTFGPHIDIVTNKCQGLLGILARATRYLSKELLKLIYTALIRSHMQSSHLLPKHVSRNLMSYREKLHASYIEYHVMPMLIYYCCFSDWKILVTGPSYQAY